MPLLANMVEGGKTSAQSADELGQRGFRIVIFPGGTARAVAYTLQRNYDSMNSHQTTASMRDAMFDFDRLNNLIGTPAVLASVRPTAGHLAHHHRQRHHPDAGDQHPGDEVAV